MYWMQYFDWGPIGQTWIDLRMREPCVSEFLTTY